MPEEDTIKTAVPQNKRGFPYELFCCCGLIIFPILLIALIAGPLLDKSLQTANHPGSGNGGTGIVCNVPATYEAIFQQAAANNPGIETALLAAIFQEEHGAALGWENGYTQAQPSTPEWPESNGDPNKITLWKSSDAGAQGPFQFMTNNPNTWGDYGNGGNVQNITDAANGSARMLKKKMDQTDGSYDQKLRAAIHNYNPGETGWYTNEVMALYQKYCGGQAASGGTDLVVQGDHTFPLDKKYPVPPSHHNYPAADIETGDVHANVIVVTDGTVVWTNTVASVGAGGIGFGFRGDDGIEYYYFHMQYLDPRIVVGDRVHVGEFAGKSDNTGTNTTGPHLHFEMRQYDASGVMTRIWPQSYLAEWVKNIGKYPDK